MNIKQQKNHLGLGKTVAQMMTSLPTGQRIVRTQGDAQLKRHASRHLFYFSGFSHAGEKICSLAEKAGMFQVFSLG